VEEKGRGLHEALFRDFPRATYKNRENFQSIECPAEIRIGHLAIASPKFYYLGHLTRENTLNKICNQNLRFTKTVYYVVLWCAVQFILFLSVLHKNMRSLLDAERLLIKEIRRCHAFPTARLAAWPANTIYVSICLLLYCNWQPLHSRLGGARSRSQRCGEELVASLSLPEM
jgi:hypothetical protein